MQFFGDTGCINYEISALLTPYQVGQLRERLKSVTIARDGNNFYLVDADEPYAPRQALTFINCMLMMNMRKK